LGVDELVKMSRVIWKTLLIQLALVEAIHKELQRSFQGFWAARKAARATGQTSQIVAQLGIIGFDREGLCLPLRDFRHTLVIPQPIVDIKSIAVIAPGLGCFIHHLLCGCLHSLPGDPKTQIAAGQPVYDRDDKELVFCPR
jgi:hypothetical protein